MFGSPGSGKYMLSMQYLYGVLITLLQDVRTGKGVSIYHISQLSTKVLCDRSKGMFISILVGGGWKKTILDAAKYKVICYGMHCHAVMATIWQKAQNVVMH